MHGLLQPLEPFLRLENKCNHAVKRNTKKKKERKSKNQEKIKNQIQKLEKAKAHNRIISYIKVLKYVLSCYSNLLTVRESTHAKIAQTNNLKSYHSISKIEEI